MSSAEIQPLESKAVNETVYSLDKRKNAIR